jgi:hypothetical protein
MSSDASPVLSSFRRISTTSGSKGVISAAREEEVNQMAADDSYPIPGIIAPNANLLITLYME